MKHGYRQGAASLLIWAFFAGFASAPPGETELFQNTGFEDKLEGWRALNMSSSCEFEIDKKVKKGGKASVRVERGDGTRPDFLKQFVDMPADAREVEFTALARVDKVGKVRVTLLFSDDSDKALLAPEIGVQTNTRKKWKELSGKFDVPEGTTRVGVNFWFNEPGTVWLDEVSLRWEGPSKTSGKSKKQKSLTLSNGEFTKGIEGWEPIDLGESSTKGRHDKGVGKGCLVLERDGKRLFPMGGYEARAERGNREKRAKLSFSARAESGVRASVSLQALGAGGALLGSERVEVVAGGKRLSKESLKLDIPNGTTQLAVVACIGGDGKAWFDDFDLGGR